MVEFRGYEYGPAQRQHGMDHPHYEWSPLPQRPALRWPGDAPLAVGAVVVLEHYEWDPPEEAYALRQPSGGLLKLPSPDYVQLTQREYGHRVGIFRILDLLDRYNITPTVAVDALTAEHYPWLMRHLVERGCEIIGHGISASRLITSKLSEEQEVEMIESSLGAIEAAIGRRPRGWYSAEGVESFRSPQLLASAGIDYLCDWPNDEQPYAMTVDDGQLSALPLTLELDDEFALWHRRASLTSWIGMMGAAADRLRIDGASSGRLLLLGLRPWLSGQPFRIGYLARGLAAVFAGGPTFTGSGSQLVDAERAARPS